MQMNRRQFLPMLAAPFVAPLVVPLLPSVDLPASGFSAGRLDHAGFMVEMNSDIDLTQFEMKLGRGMMFTFPAGWEIYPLNPGSSS